MLIFLPPPTPLESVAVKAMEKTANKMRNSPCPLMLPVWLFPLNEDGRKQYYQYLGKVPFKKSNIHVIAKTTFITKLHIMIQVSKMATLTVFTLL